MCKCAFVNAYDVFALFLGLITIKEAHDIEARLNEVEKLLKTIINMPWKVSKPSSNLAQLDSSFMVTCTLMQIRMWWALPNSERSSNLLSNLEKCWVPELYNDASKLSFVISLSVILWRGGNGEEGQSKLLVKNGCLFFFSLFKYSRSEVVLTFFERSPLDQVLKNDNVHKIQPSFQSPVKISGKNC